MGENSATGTIMNSPPSTPKRPLEFADVAIAPDYRMWSKAAPKRPLLGGGPPGLVTTVTVADATAVVHLLPTGPQPRPRSPGVRRQSTGPPATPLIVRWWGGKVRPAKPRGQTGTRPCYSCRGHCRTIWQRGSSRVRSMWPSP